MSTIAKTPAAPYYAVIFTSLRTGLDDGYGDMAARMEELAVQQPGFLGVESARQEVGITVSYWADLESIRAWKVNAEHQIAQQTGREKWYAAYTTRIAKVEREYSFAAALAEEEDNVTNAMQKARKWGPFAKSTRGCGYAALRRRATVAIRPKPANNMA